MEQEVKEESYYERSKRQAFERLQKLAEVQDILVKYPEFGLTYFSDCMGKIILHCSSMKDMGAKKHKLRKLFPDIRFEFSKWSPYENKVILQWIDTRYMIALWVETTVEDDPTRKPNQPCKFIKLQSESYQLVCSKESDQ